MLAPNEERNENPTYEKYLVAGALGVTGRTLINCGSFHLATTIRQLVTSTFRIILMILLIMMYLFCTFGGPIRMSETSTLRRSSNMLVMASC